MKFDDELKSITEGAHVGTAYPTSIKIVKRIEHPKYITFSDSFKSALASELEKIKKEHPEKHERHIKNSFLKALRFYV